MVQVTSKTQELADFHMELMLNEAYEEVKAMMERNREVSLRPHALRPPHEALGIRDEWKLYLSNLSH